MKGLKIENDLKKLKKLDRLLLEYWAYLQTREKKSIGAQIVALVGRRIQGHIKELEPK